MKEAGRALVSHDSQRGQEKACVKPLHCVNSASGALWAKELEGTEFTHRELLRVQRKRRNEGLSEQSGLLPGGG
jgi:hypothetical protein